MAEGEFKRLQRVLTDKIEALCPEVMDRRRFGVSCTVAQVFYSPTEQVRRLDLSGRSAIERYTKR